MGTEAGRPVRRPRQCLKARVGWQGECVWSVLDASGTNGVWMSEASIGNCFVCRDAGPPTTGHTQAPGLSPWKKRKAKTVSSKSWQGSPYIEAQREHTRTHTHTTHMPDLHTPPHTHTQSHYVSCQAGCKHFPDSQPSILFTLSHCPFDRWDNRDLERPSRLITPQQEDPERPLQPLSP